MNTPRKYFTPEGYRRLAQNPFVDQKMLQFIKNKTRQKSATSSADTPTPLAGKTVPTTVRAPVMSDQAAKLIAAALKGLLRE